MANAHVRSRPIVESLGILTGAGGADYVAGATVNAHTYVAITILTGDTDDAKNSTATVSATSVDTDIWDSLSTIEVPVGTTIYGKWSAVTIASNDVAMVYRESSSD
tara:strand:- start:278 stop:595 length:318 start_codon:yes stop_codon:yes gene_type:complete